MPRYKINETSYIDDKIVDAGTEITADARHVPGPHWEPLDDEAKKLCKKHGIKQGAVPDPIDSLTNVLSDAQKAAAATAVGEQTASLV